jgi:tetratricopeptide (TPR) repeat protein
LTIRQDLVSQFPDSLEFRQYLFESHMDLGRVMLVAGRKQEGVSHYGAALDVGRDLVLQEHFDETAFPQPDQLIGYYSNVAWCAALSGSHEEALKFGEQAASLLDHEEPCPARMNLAHAYLFNSQFEKAREIHEQYLGTAFEDGRKWNDEVRNDFKLLREAGQDHPDMKKIEAML